MSKTMLKCSPLLAPLPVVMVSMGDETDKNIITVAWCGVVCSNPPRVYISVRKERHSHSLLKKHGCFVIHLTSKDLVAACDYCGIRSGRDVDKFKEMGLTAVKANLVDAPLIAESPVCLECKVFDVLDLGSHDMFLADVLAVDVDDSIMTDGGKADFEKAQLVCYSHGEYYSVAKHLGRFGFAAQKKFIRDNGKGVNVNIDNATLTKRNENKNK